MINNPHLLRSIIMDHYEYPRNKRKADDSYHHAHIASTSCVDDIQVQLKIEENIIKDICFDGVGCTISIAASSIMSELLLNKSVEEANYIIEEYYKMIKQESFDEKLLQEAVAFHNVGKQANRINCATIGWRAVSKILKENED